MKLLNFRLIFYFSAEKYDQSTKKRTLCQTVAAICIHKKVTVGYIELKPADTASHYSSSRNESKRSERIIKEDKESSAKPLLRDTPKMNQVQPKVSQKSEKQSN